MANRATTTLDAVNDRNARTVEPPLASAIRSEYAPLRKTTLSAVGVPVRVEKMSPPAVETTPCSMPVSQTAEEREQGEGAVCTRVVALAELLAVLGSLSEPVTEAVLLIVPAVLGAVTVIVRVTLCVALRPPIVQVTVPDALTQPAEADTNVTPAGSVSVAVTEVALLGPALATVSV